MLHQADEKWMCEKKWSNRERGRKTGERVQEREDEGENDEAF